MFAASRVSERHSICPICEADHINLLQRRGDSAACIHFGTLQCPDHTMTDGASSCLPWKDEQIGKIYLPEPVTTALIRLVAQSYSANVGQKTQKSNMTATVTAYLATLSLPLHDRIAYSVLLPICFPDAMARRRLGTLTQRVVPDLFMCCWPTGPMTCVTWLPLVGKRAQACHALPSGTSPPSSATTGGSPPPDRPTPSPQAPTSSQSPTSCPTSTTTPTTMCQALAARTCGGDTRLQDASTSLGMALCGRGMYLVGLYCRALRRSSTGRTTRDLGGGDSHTATVGQSGSPAPQGSSPSQATPVSSPTQASSEATSSTGLKIQSAGIARLLSVPTSRTTENATGSSETTLNGDDPSLGHYSVGLPPGLDCAVRSDGSTGGTQRSEYVSSLGWCTVLRTERVTDAGGEPTPGIGAVKIGPSLVVPQVFENGPENSYEAVKERVIKKQTTLQWTKQEEEVAANFAQRCILGVGHARGGPIFGKNLIDNWAAEHPELQDLCSKKWSATRAQHAYDALLARPDPLRPKFAVKLEALEENGKPPRSLIADGDEAQLAGLAVVSCIEKLLFARFGGSSIKGKKVDDALKQMILEMRGPSVKQQTTAKCCLEGDGSAWDATCTHAIRKRTEHVIISHVTKRLVQTMGVPQRFLDEALKLEKDAKTKGKIRAANYATGLFTREVYTCIDSIRRSGQRGTSAFNWFLNWFVWMMAITNEPWLALDPCRRNFPCRWGKGQVWVVYAFEGDDSFLCSTGLEQYETEISAFWERSGFRMKLIIHRVKPGEKRAATFIGHNILVDEYGPVPESFMPEPMRGFKSAPWSTSSELRACAQENTKKSRSTFHRIAAASYIARYEGMAGRFPELASVYKAVAHYHINELADWQSMVCDHETTMKMCGNVEMALTLEEAYMRALTNETRPRLGDLIECLHLSCDAEKSAMMLGTTDLGPDDDANLRMMVPQGWIKQ